MSDYQPIRRAAALVALAALVVSPAFAEWTPGTSTVHYDVTFPDIEHNEARITATFSGLVENEPLELRMSRTSPGRYSLHEFAKNVYDVEAVDGSGKAARTERRDPFSWRVIGHDGTVSVSYTLFADQADGTYSGFDRTHAHINMPATFMWADGHEDAAISVRFTPPDPDWTIATQLFPTDDPHTFSAPDLDYFLDSPTEIARLEWFRWRLDGESGQEIRIALHHEGSRAAAEAFAASVRKLVDAQIAVFGAPPAYDGGTYTFIVDFLPHVFGDGMEHRNSTVVTGTNPLSDDGLSNLGTISHEYFHQWNVERIRPADLEPFDYFGPNPTDLLWFAEGFTSYYTDLTLRRAGLVSVKEYAEGLAGTIETVVHSPGRRHRSPVEMSRMATLSDRAVFWDRTNYENTFI
ncbi:MAG: M61 family metallopeptidase, partial [Rhodothermales bacterium]|nr:M61 family metallopeptidase [Rhodothermales bacterium]